MTTNKSKFEEVTGDIRTKEFIPYFKKLIASSPNLSPEKILESLKVEYRVNPQLQSRVPISKQDGLPIFPHPRTIARWKAALASELKQQWFNDFYSWPSSHMDGDVPWEAATMALQIARSRQRKILKPPTLRQIRWAYWLHQSAPDCPITSYVKETEEDFYQFEGYDYKLRWNIETVSEQLAKTEDMRPVHTMRPLTMSNSPVMIMESDAHKIGAVSFLKVVEQWLMWAPWRSVKNAQEYYEHELLHADTVRPNDVLIAPQLFVDYAASIPTSEPSNYEVDEDGEWSIGEVGRDGHFAIYMPRYELSTPELLPIADIPAFRRRQMVMLMASQIFGVTNSDGLPITHELKE